MVKIKKLLAACLLWSVAHCAVASTDTFVIKKIDVEGLSRISTGTVYTYLPVKEGDTYKPSQADAIIKALYKTRFFSDVVLERDGDTLIIRVEERPVIGSVTITGNSDIPTDKLKDALNHLGVEDGQVFDRTTLNDVKESLQEQYYSRGKYNARVNVDVTNEERNRVAIAITISEGVAARIQSINIIGNHVFSTSTLTSQLTVTTPGWFTWLTGDDQYSRAKLEASLEALRAYYMDRGYINFTIDSVQVAITPDRKSVYLVMNITEGDCYSFAGYVLKGKFVLPKATLENLVTIKKGDVFSRQIVLDSDNAITQALGDKGYAFAHVDAVPAIDDKAKTVMMTLTVQPGHVTYVDQIHFAGNSSVNDNVLRQAMRQMEGGIYNASNIKQSTWQLNQLPYLQSVDSHVVKVPGKEDHVDVNYKMEQKNSANFVASIGYSQLDKFIFSTGVVEHNLFGTGKSLGFNFTKSRGYQSYNINYTNPYYTPDGVSRSVNLYLTQVDPGDVNLTNSYSISQSGFNVSYGIPVSEAVGSQDDVSVGYGFQNTLLNVSSGAPTQVTDFTDNFGTHYESVPLNAGWTHNGLDRAVFPTSGFTQSVGGVIAPPANSNTVGYYTTNYDTKYYLPLNTNHHYILQMGGGGNFGSGFARSGRLPFYNNFYSGGWGSVLGYEGNAMGPSDSNGDPIGGNLSLYASTALIFPNPISPNNLRTSLFVNAGNVFNTYDSCDVSDLRYSVGIEFDWLTPMGLIKFSLAKALNPNGDATEPFQFTVGTSF